MTNSCHQRLPGVGHMQEGSSLLLQVSGRGVVVAYRLALPQTSRPCTLRGASLTHSSTYYMFLDHCRIYPVSAGCWLFCNQVPVQSTLFFGHCSPLLLRIVFTLSKLATSHHIHEDMLLHYVFQTWQDYQGSQEEGQTPSAK